MSDLIFWSEDRRFGLHLNKSYLQKILRECSEANHEETGGILLGYYTPHHDCAVVTQVTGPPDDSIQRARLFRRGVRGLQALINKVWTRQQCFYLGDWHFHPGAPAEASSDDVIQMKVFSRDEDLKCPEPVLLILGGDPEGRWLTRASVYPRGADVVHLIRRIEE